MFGPWSNVWTLVKCLDRGQIVKGRTWLRDPVLRLGGVRCVSTSIRMPWRMRPCLGQGEVRRAPEPVVILRVDVRAGSNVWIMVKYLDRGQMFGPW
jgi:hypothetical protein